MILQHEVDALWAGYSSATREAIRPIINDYEQLYFYTTQYEGRVCDSTIFPVGATARQQLGAVTPYLAEEYGEDIYIIATDYNFGQLSGDWVNVIAQENGYNIVGMTTVFGVVVEQVIVQHHYDRLLDSMVTTWGLPWWSPNCYLSN